MPGVSKFLGGAVAAFVTVAAVIAGWLWNSVHTPLPGIGEGEATLLEVRPGAAASTVARQLHEDGLISSPRLFSLWARISGQADRLQDGEYELPVGITMAGLLDLMVSGKVKLHPFTIVEGWTWREVRDALAASEVIRSTTEFSDPAAMAAHLPDDPGHAEGRLFPDTYAIARGATDVEVLRRAAELMNRKLAAAWAGRAADLPLQSPRELLTLASIVERETSLDDERAAVAGVFVRRLRKNMRLQTDPTVIYGLGDSFDGNLTRRHLLSDTPYNTYTRGGLPPTPIAMPGEAALRAAAHPADGTALYFVASEKLDGSHYFSATLEEHNAAVSAYVAALRRARLNQR